MSNPLELAELTVQKFAVWDPAREHIVACSSDATCSAWVRVFFRRRLLADLGVWWLALERST